MTRSPVCVLFDVDGTLCDTNEVDDLCYREAAGYALGVSPDEIDWTSAPHRTDSGIARWLWMRFRKRPPTPGEKALLRQDFVRRLRGALDRSPNRFRCISGARELLQSLRNANIAVGIATGGWRSSAELKLAAAGLDVTYLLATADDAEVRAAIFSQAHRLVTGSSSPCPTLLFGDSVHDLHTARQMEWHFLGVASGQTDRSLRDAGARVVVADYSELDGSALRRMWAQADVCRR